MQGDTSAKAKTEKQGDKEKRHMHNAAPNAHRDMTEKLRDK